MDGFSISNRPRVLRTYESNTLHSFLYSFSRKVLPFSFALALPWAATAWAAKPMLETAFLEEQVSVQQSTGLLKFIGAPPGKAVSLRKPPRGNATKDFGLAFASEYGEAFGISDASKQLRLRENTELAGRGDSLRYQQMYRGLPVFAGELVVNLDHKKALLSMNAEISTVDTLPITPILTAEDALALALEATAKWYGMEISQLQANEPLLTVYDPSLLKPGTSKPSLVWQLDVVSNEVLPIRELILVDAHTGTINLHFNQVHKARDRNTHTASMTFTLPGDLVLSEGDSLAAAGGDVDVIDAHMFAGDSYDFYAGLHGRDGIDDMGSPIVSTVHWYQSGVCPNAYWNGVQMVYCTNMASADDVVGHELTHGVTDYESGLLYYYESGAINESLSDIWGEFIDLTNGAGNDSPSVRWLIGEDLDALGGAIRDMQFPGSFGDPDRMTSPNYHVLSTDQGGVHTNSGVNNKAAYLMTDGDTFNGITVNGIGIDKTARIYYEAQTNLLTSAADHSDLYLALYQACLNLVGTSGIIENDCTEVRNATDAVEMNMDPAGDPNFKPQATICPDGTSQDQVLFFDDLESGSDNWSSGTHTWYWYSHYSNSGTYSIGSPDAHSKKDASAWNTVPVALGSDAFLHFNHGFGFEAYDTYYFDGGVIEYSTDGATWQDLAGLYDDGQGYVGNIDSNWGNPLAGRAAFVAGSHGMVSSRYNLGTLAGQNFQVRFRMGSDKSVAGPLGWMVDDVSIHSCTTGPAAPPDCSGTNVLVQNRDFTSNTVCQASSSLEANTAVVIKAGSAVTFQSQGTTLGSGFSVESGATFTVETS